MGGHPVLLRLRAAIDKKPSAFVEELRKTATQLSMSMADGVALGAQDAEELRQQVLKLVRDEALPSLAQRDPSASLAALDQLAVYGMAQLEPERPKLVAARAAQFPPPVPASWPEVADLRAAAAGNAEACVLEPAAQNVFFAQRLKDDEELSLPDDLLALYAAINGFDLFSDGYPVFSLLAGESIDTRDRTDDVPERAVVFLSGDDVYLSVYRDRKRSWWLVYDYETEAIAKRELDLRGLLRFGLQRMEATSLEALNEGELSWERYFTTFFDT